MTTRLFNVILHNGRSTALVMVCSTAHDALQFAADRRAKTGAKVEVTDGAGKVLADADLLKLINADVIEEDARPASLGRGG